MSTTTRVPLAGYCAICERPAAELIIREDRRTIVHSGSASVCTLPHPPADAPRARPQGSERFPANVDLLERIVALLGDGQPRTLREIRAATRGERVPVYSQVQALCQSGRADRTWRKSAGAWSYWLTDTARQVSG